MQDEYDAALKDYFAKWQNLCAERENAQFFQDMKPIAVGWKVKDAAEHQKVYAGLRGSYDKIVETWMNGRWIAKMHLKNRELVGGSTIFKLMQLRPGSNDALGLDHVDFYSPAVADAENILQQESGLKWTHESNDAVKEYHWISVWFDGTEAKLRSDTVIDTVVGELQQVNARIK